jgi:hypothetical protein
MTGMQELHDEIMGLEAQLAGKRLELAMAQGERDTARQHLHAMHAAIQALRAFRIGVADSAGRCYFDAAGSVDAMGVN